MIKTLLLLAAFLVANLFAVNSSVRSSSNVIVNISSKFDMGKSQSPFNFDPFFGNFHNPEFSGLELKKLKRRLGSGIIIGSDGYILTNYHIIAGAKALTVTLAGNDEEITANVIGVDQISDIAVLKIERKNLPSFFYGNNPYVDSGTEVYALGNPYGKDVFISRAMVSYVIKENSLEEKTKYIQSNGNIHPLSSGGALVDKTGQFLGIVNANYTKETGLRGFFITVPLSTIKSSVTRILEKEQKEPVWFGIAIGSIDKELYEYYNKKKGVVVISVEADSPAEKAGLKKGDLIISIDDVPVDDISDMNYRIATMRPGDIKLIEYQRDRAIEETVVTLARPFGKVADSSNGVMVNGLILEPLTRKLRRTLAIDKDFRGVVVSSVTSGSTAKKAGFQKGDIIIRLGSKEIPNVDTMKVLLIPSTQTFTIFRKGIIKNIIWEKNE